MVCPQFLSFHLPTVLWLIVLFSSFPEYGLLKDLVSAPVGRQDQETNSKEDENYILAIIIESSKSDCAVLSPPSYNSENQGGACLSNL